MQIYKYTAKDITGKKISGTAKADSTSALMTLLAEKSIFLTDCQELKVETIKTKLNLKELSDLSREIGTMLAAGIPLTKATDIIANRENAPKIKKICSDLSVSLKKGLSLSESLGKEGSTFPELFINMVVAGEASGQLDKAILKMATYYERESRLNSKLKNAMTYPTLLFIVTIMVVIIIFTFVLPNFLSSFQNMELPLPTRIAMAISNALVNHWLLISIIVVILIIAISVIIKREKVKIFIDKFKLKIPKFKNFLKILYTARFARTLSALYSSGMPLVNAVQTSYLTIGNKYIASQFHDVMTQVKSGVSLSSAIIKIDGFDSKLASIIQIGEETGKLADMLNSVSDSYEYESEISAQKMLVIIEPVMLIFMALIIGSILLAVMMPILQMYQNVGI